MTQNASKGFAGFEDFDGCVRAHDGEVEDPESFCGWLQEEAKDALSDPNAKNVLTSLTSEFVSSVDTPAQDSEWLLFKDADTPRRKAREIERPYVFADRDDVSSKAADVDVRRTNDDGEKQIAFAAVLIPNEVDKQGDVIPPYVVERSAHEYMAEYRKMDSDHDLEDGAGVPVESYLLREATDFTTPDGDTVTYPEGTWIMGKRFVDDEWKRVKSGELNGFSIYGAGTPVRVDDLSDAVKRRASKSNTNHERMKQVLKDALSSDDPGEYLARHIQQSKANMPDEEAAELAQTLSQAAQRLEQAYDEDKDEDGFEDEPDEEDEDETDEHEDGNMKNENETDEHEDGNGDVGLPDDTPEWAKSIHDTAKSTEEAVGGIRDDVDTLQSRVDDLEKEVDPDAAPQNDRMEGNGEDGDTNERMKSVEKQVGSLLEAVGVDPDEADDPKVVRKGIREQAEKTNGDDTQTTDSYEGIVDDEDEAGITTGGVEGNPRLKGGK